MNDWKTTLTGLITALASLLSHFGILIPESFQTFIIMIGVFVLGLVAKDAKSSSSTK
jgi:hypothetical protein